METTLLATLSIAIICLVLGIIIGFIAKIFAVETDPRIEETEELLPGANCGGCGFAGCTDFAKACVAGDATPDQCPVCSGANVSKISNLLGLSTGSAEKEVAVVLCGGNNTDAQKNVKYNGIKDCKSASLVAGGDKGCDAGCLGFATCARACPFDAIEMKNGLAIVHNDICVGCGKCVATCPRGIIKMIPEKTEVNIFCNSKEKGAAKKKFCNVSCIGCRKCVKVAEEDQMKIDGFLVSVNYENAPGKEIIEAAKCPTGCLR